MRLGENNKEIGDFLPIGLRENWKPLLLVAIILVGGVVSGCTGVVTATSGNVLIQLNPASVNFGNVTVGKTSSSAVTIRNAGTASATVSQATVSNSQFKLSGITLPMTVAAGQSSIVTVSVTPTASGPISGTLSVLGDSGSAPVVVNLAATAVATNPQIAVSNATINFGSVTVNTQATSNLTISNTGSADLTVSMISVSGTGFGATGITTPKVISAGQSAPLSISFSPTTTTASSGTLSITSNDPTNPTTTVALSGTGTAAPVGNLQANQSSLSYGNVGTGTSSVKQITLTNAGTAAVQITGVSITGTGLTASGLTVPTTLNPSATATLSVTFAPTAAGAVSGNLTITSNGSGSPLTIPVSGTGVQAGLSVSPSSFNFGSVIDGQTKSQTFTITNTGTVTLTISQISITAAGYSVNGLSTTSVAPGGTATFNAVFAPTTAGSLAGSVSIASNAPTSPSTVALTGTGIAITQTLSFSATTLAFGNVNTGTSSTKTETITNTGNTSVQISQIGVSGTGYTLSGATVPATLNPSQTLTFSVVFTPTTAGAASGSVTITSNAAGSPATIALSGTGAQPGLTVSPASFNFGSVIDGQSKSQNFTITNSGTASLTISQLSISAAGYTVNGLSVPSTVAAGGSTTFNAVFMPTTAASLAGTVNIVSNAPNSPTTVALSGTGVAATQTISFSSSSLAFGSVNTGTSSTLNETITNTGNSTVTISLITVGGSGYSLNGAGAPVTLNAGQALTFSVIFDPATAGALNGTVTVTSSAAGSPATITLSGTGVQAVSHTVGLTWTDTGSAITGYNIYRSTTSGSGYVKITGSLLPTTSYTDSTVQGGTTYFYVATAVDNTGTESAFSNEAQAIVP
ncbi:MAG TPA: choice-of-anchor D domain-containing protein [Candidatus Acidoferrum sp.]|nr:choice-of-anchor D domain-containing protein [Candidatus Acidoferrum sp.]